MKIFSRPPFLLYSYLATEMLAPFFASFVILNCVLFLVKLIPLLNYVLTLNIGLADLIRTFSYLFPNLLLYSIPMAAMIGVTISFARLSSDSEILALKAGGISLYQILPPVIIVAVFISLLTSFVSIKLIPVSAVAMRQLSYQLLKEKISKGIKEHVFTEALGDVVVYVDRIDNTTGEWSKVWVSDMRGVELPIVTMASTGKMSSSIQDMTVSIDLRNGSLHKPSKEIAQIVQFDRYQITIPLQPPETKATRSKRTSLTMRELLEEAQLAAVDSEDKRKALIEFHKRLVLPVGCLMMSLIGLPLGLQARPGQKAVGIQAGLAIFVLYYILFTLGKALAEQGTLPPGLAMWCPNILFFTLAIFWIGRVSNERPLIPAVLAAFLRKTMGFVLTPIMTACRILVQKLRGASESAVDDERNTLSTANTTVRGDAQNRVFHLPGCEHYNCPHCTLVFKDVQVARDAGFAPCRSCKTLLEQ